LGFVVSSYFDLALDQHVEIPPGLAGAVEDLSFHQLPEL
jgi:hypothetical protein